MLKRIKRAINIWKLTKGEEDIVIEKTLDEIKTTGAFIPFPDEDEYDKYVDETEQRNKLGALYDKIKSLL